MYHPQQDDTDLIKQAPTTTHHLPGAVIHAKGDVVGIHLYLLHIDLDGALLGSAGRRRPSIPYALAQAARQQHDVLGLGKISWSVRT